MRFFFALLGMKNMDSNAGPTEIQFDELIY